MLNTDMTFRKIRQIEVIFFNDKFLLIYLELNFN